MPRFHPYSVPRLAGYAMRSGPFGAAIFEVESLKKSDGCFLAPRGMPQLPEPGLESHYRATAMVFADEPRVQLFVLYSGRRGARLLPRRPYGHGVWSAGFILSSRGVAFRAGGCVYITVGLLRAHPPNPLHRLLEGKIG